MPEKATVLVEVGGEAKRVPNAIVGGASGGSGGGSDFVTVTFTVDENGAFVADKSYEEIHDAYNAGKDIRGMIMYAPDDVGVLTLSAVSHSEVSFFIVSVSANDGSGGIIELYYPKFGVIQAFMTPLTFTELNPTT